MTENISLAAIAIRPAAFRDAEGITRIYLESADYHASLDADRYWIPDAQAIKARYREGGQHPPHGEGEAVTLVAELSGEVVGFLDARLMRSPDPMHREMLYCHVAELAVSKTNRRHGIGALLLGAAKDWGRHQGAELTSLEYLATNKRAEAFYGRLGYRPGSVIAIKRL